MMPNFVSRLERRSQKGVVSMAAQHPIYHGFANHVQRRGGENFAGGKHLERSSHLELSWLQGWGGRRVAMRPFSQL